MRFVLLLVVIASGATSAAEPDTNPIVVTTQDGRRLTGEVDAKSSSSTLWVRHEVEAIRVTTAIDWTNIDKVTIDGDGVAADAWQETLLKRATEPSAYFLWNEHQQAQLPMPPRRDMRPVVDSVVVEAVPASWDDDIELDGMLVRVACLDAAGNIVPAEATLDLRLVGERLATTRRVDGPVDLERWTGALRADHFAGRPAEFRFPFQNIVPDRDFRIGAEAEVTGTVGIMGQGHLPFAVPVVLQTFSPLRDRWQQRTGERVLPGER